MPGNLSKLDDGSYTWAYDVEITRLTKGYNNFIFNYYKGETHETGIGKSKHSSVLPEWHKREHLGSAQVFPQVPETHTLPGLHFLKIIG